MGGPNCTGHDHAKPYVLMLRNTGVGDGGKRAMRAGGESRKMRRGGGGDTQQGNAVARAARYDSIQQNIEWDG